LEGEFLQKVPSQMKKREKRRTKQESEYWEAISL